MKNLRSLKTGLLAAASLTAATSAAHAADIARGDGPAALAATEIVHVEKAPAAAVVSADSDQSNIPHKWLIAAFATGALAGLVRLFGVKKLADKIAAAAPAITASAKEAVKAPLKVAKSLGGAIATPFKFALFFSGASALAFVGLGLFQVEWAGGLVIGAAMVAAAWLGAEKIRRAAKPETVKPTADRRP
ncbi:MAG: hypothetical protein AAGJ73_06180 [Pseudomonadota bacterium]